MKKTILVVDDNESNMKLFRALLKQGGYDVLEAVNGAEGVEKAKKELPGLIFMDVQMPVMDGIEALRLLKADGTTADIPVVAVTSYAMSGDMERLIGLGFNDYLAKPVNMGQFLGLVLKYIG